MESLRKIRKVMGVVKMECFCVMSNEIEGRIDPFYYRMEFLELEKKVKLKSNKVLGDFIVEISGGATPSRNNEEELYSNEKEGIPFLRVQNITEEGLVLNNVKFITREVHEKQLKRSQVKEDNLLITITGRIASSCVVPKGFEGNINQHSVVIKTESLEISNLLAKYLNSSIGHKLALRRTSGGSRLALDYISLKSIPVIEEAKIVELMDKAYLQKKQKDAEAKKLSDSIDEFVLEQLGIKIPELKNKMCFVVDYNQIQSGRIDSVNFANPQDTLSSTKIKEKILDEVASLVKGQSITKENITSGNYPVVAGGQSSPYSINACNHEGNVITVSASGAYSGYVWYHYNPIFASDCTVIKSLDEKEVPTFYLYCVMKAKQKFIYNMQQGAGQPHVYSRDLSNLKIPLPSLPIQNKIAEEVKQRMHKVEQLQKEAKEELKKVKKEIEEMILSQ